MIRPSLSSWASVEVVLKSVKSVASMTLFLNIVYLPFGSRRSDLNKQLLLAKIGDDPGAPRLTQDEYHIRHRCLSLPINRDHVVAATAGDGRCVSGKPHFRALEVDGPGASVVKTAGVLFRVAS